ncbi:hypothetical protein ACIF6L_25725 [Kitasatospora sp. NPDC086009]|uniref:hypothetical protein n=1 Tax=unclassified Kitasatospora TaxID=2633591 RepID=UPI0037C6F1A9
MLARTAIPFGPAQVPSLGGFRATFAIGAGAAALGVLVIAFVPRRRREAAPVVLTVVPDGAGADRGDTTGDTTGVAARGGRRGRRPRTPSRGRQLDCRGQRLRPQP